MATPVLRRFEGSHPSMYIADACASFFPATSTTAASPVSSLPNDIRVPQDALNGAKGAVAALGVEVASAIFLYGLWLIWHVVR
jgi:hypothetical protein